MIPVDLLTSRGQIMIAYNDEKWHCAHMTSAGPHLKARAYIGNLAAAGRYHFSGAEAREALGVSAAAGNAALHRLAKQGLIASPARGFYLVVPPEYRSLGCLPAEQFIPTLMERQGRPYYAGLLTAAQYHGAAHQRPQAFQVFTDRSRRDLSCGRVRVTFMRRRLLGAVPVETRNTPRGVLRVSTPEATAIDLIGYQDQAGGLDHVAQVIFELADRIRPEALRAAAETAPIAWAQRLGFLLERAETAAGGIELADLKEYVLVHARESTPLLPGQPHEKSERNSDWRLWVNARVEPEL